MTTGYELFKTPFFEVSVARAGSAQYVKLPYQVHKLISKVEITESFVPCTPLQISLTLYEGSRQPFLLIAGVAD